MTISSNEHLQEELVRLYARLAQAETARQQAEQERDRALAALNATQAHQQARPKEFKLNDDYTGSEFTGHTDKNLRYLVEANNILASSLDYETTLMSLAQLVVPRLADWCLVYITEDNGELRRLEVLHSDPIQQAEARALLQRYSFDLREPHPVVSVLKSGQSEFYPHINDAQLAAIATNEEVMQALRRMQLRSALHVPLRARNRTLGVITFVTAESGRCYTPADLSLAEELAGRAALAVDNARLYQAAQQALRDKDESLALFNTLLSSAPVGLAFLDRDLRYVHINDSLAAVNGSTPAAHIGRRMRDVIPWAAASQEALLKRVLTNGETIENLEMTNLRPHSPDDTKYWLASYNPVRTQNNEILGIGVAVVDITERKRDEKRQIFLAEVGKVLASSLDYAVTLQNLANLAVAEMADWCTVDIAVNKGKIERQALAYGEQTNTALVNEWQAVHISNSTTLNRVFSTGQPLILSHVSPEQLAQIAQNKHHLELLKNANISSYMAVPLIARGQTLGVITFIMSESERRYTQADLELALELARRTALSVDNARLYKEMQKALEAQQELDHLKDRFLSIASHELRTPLTSIKGYSQLLERNFIKRQAANQQDNRETQKLNVDLNREARMFDSVGRQIARMESLISEMLDVSRIQSGQLILKLTPGLNLVALVRQIVEQQQVAAPDYCFNFQSAVPVVTGNWDETRLEQVFSNLLSNAVKYSPAASSVTVGVELVASPLSLVPGQQAGVRGWGLEVSGREVASPLSLVSGQEQSSITLAPEPQLPTPEEVVVWVRDEGIGISPEAQGHIFERFYRARSDEGQNVDGLGLGLYISHEIVGQHGGRMWLESAVGKGSTFYVALPIAD